MITGEEVRDITNTEVTHSYVVSKKWTVASSASNGFYFSNKNRTIGTYYYGYASENTNLAWLIENTEEEDADSGATSNGLENWGYWTLSPTSDYDYLAWNVDRYGIMDYHFVSGAAYGVRPVITILKSKTNVI